MDRMERGDIRCAIQKDRSGYNVGDELKARYKEPDWIELYKSRKEVMAT